MCHLHTGPHPPQINPNLAIKRGGHPKGQAASNWHSQVHEFCLCSNAEPRPFTVDDSGPRLHTPLDLGALHEWLLSSPWPCGISAEDISVKIASGVKRLGRCTRQLEVVCPRHWFHRDPIALSSYWSIPQDPYTLPMPHWGIRAQASKWPTLKGKNGKFSIGRHTSLYEIGILPATYLWGHSNDTRSPFWLLGFHECGEWGVYKHESMLGVGNDRKSLQMGGGFSVCACMCMCMCVCVEVGLLALVHGIPFPKCFPRQISHAF